MGDPTAPTSLNRFIYVQDNPILYKDATGRERTLGEGGGGGGGKDNSKNKLIQGSTKDVRDAIKELNFGSKEVKVPTRDEAAEVFFRKYQGDKRGYKNTTGMLASETKNLLGDTEGTYHWDNEGHGDWRYKHLQVHTWEGPIIRIFYGSRLS